MATYWILTARYRSLLVSLVLAVIVLAAPPSVATTTTASPVPTPTASIYTSGSITLELQPTPAIYTVPADLVPYLNQSAKVKLVHPGENSVPTLEWTALGDSYASGPGSTKYVDGRRCFRYDEPYPRLMDLNPFYTGNSSGIFPAGPHKLNNVVCSGATSNDVLKWQLLDEPTWGVPDLTFGTRPAFGSPEFATLTSGGDDVDFPGILFNCILGTHIVGGPPQRICTDQRAYTWSLLRDDQWIKDLTNLISAIMDKGRKGPKGNGFMLFVTGYGQFFNSATTKSDGSNCEGTTFQIDGFINSRPLGPEGAKDAYLTVDIRQDFNNMAFALNNGIQKAIKVYNDELHVHWVDIEIDANGNDLLSGHRFCEPNIKEPDLTNKNSFIWHYPYKFPSEQNVTDAPTDGLAAAFIAAANQTWNAASPNVTDTYPRFGQYLNAVYDNLTPALAASYGATNFSSAGFWDDYLGTRVRTFHPQVNWHETISKLILARYESAKNKLATSPKPTPSPPSPPKSAILAAWTTTCGEDNICNAGEFVYSITPNAPPPKPCGSKPLWSGADINLNADDGPSDSDLSLGPFNLHQWHNCNYTTTFSKTPTQWGSIKCSGMKESVSCTKVEQPDCAGWGSYISLGVCTW